jgi:ATP-dependent DNA helicase DinG
VGDILARNLWSHTSAVLTSATLSVAEDFSYIARSLGIENYRGFNAGTPFDFQKQSALYVPPNFPEPSHPTWKARVAAEMGELIRASGGRALLLFTSRRAMNEAYEAVAPQVRAMGHTLLKQGDAPVPKLAAQFKNDEHSVLFALKSFMVGADFQGDTCRLVILDKMPFPVPDDVVFQARCEVVDAQASSWRDKSFMALSVPIMALTLFQAHGRAIRTRDDEALIVIFDPRLHTKNYGKTILHSLPRSQRVNDLSEATAYLDALAERRGR